MNKRVGTFLLIAAFCFAFAQRADAAGLCCQLSSGVQESISGVAAPDAEQVSLHLGYSFTRMDTLKEGSNLRTTEEAKLYKKPDGTTYTSLPLSMDMFRYTLTAGYGFTPKLKAFVALPYVRNTMDMKVSNGALLGWRETTMEPESGLGDATVMGLYRLSIDREIRPSSAVTIGAGLKTPTGSAVKRSSSGRLIHAHMQPGTGSWDPLFSLIYTKMFRSFLLQSDATWQLATRNKEGYKFGNSLAVNLSGKYSVIRELNVAAGLTGLAVGRAGDRNGGYYDPVTNASLIDDPANTGGKSLWGSAGIQVLPFRNGAIDAKYQAPLWEKVNGIQLVSGNQVSLGISFNF